MNNVMPIRNTSINQSEFLLEIDDSYSLEKVKASGQMLVDSTGVSFVYLLENNDAYTYLKIPESFWEDLKEGIDRQLSFSVTNGREKISLENFLEELMYLIENIKGNSNYGEEMVHKVESTF